MNHLSHSNLSKSKLNFFRQLQQKKYRLEYRLFLAYGEKLCQEAILSGFQIEAIIIRTDYVGQVSTPIDIPIYSANFEDFAKLTDQQNPEGLLSVIKIPNWLPIKTLDFNRPSIFLWDIQDPGNLGTIIRTMYWFGVKQLLLTPSCAELTNPKVVRASMGGIFHIQPFWPENSKSWINQYAELIYAASANENSIQQIKPRKNILLLGNESHGIPPEIIHNNLVEKVSIPGYAGESLNVGVAGGILLFWMAGNSL